MKKLIYVFAISFLLINLSSCYLTQTLTNAVEYEKGMKKNKNTLKTKKRNKVYKVITFQGDTIIFNKKFAGKTSPDGVIGLPQIHLLYESVDSIIFNVKSLQSVWVNNREYSFIEQDRTGYICHVSDTVLIQYPDIESMELRKYSKELARTVGITIIAIPVAVISLIIYYDTIWY